MIEPNLDILLELKSISNSNEGSFFNNPDENGKKEQKLFVKKIIDMIKPKNVLEIGTDKGYFVYFLMLNCDTHVTTCDLWEFSSLAIDVLKKYFEKRINFFNEDSHTLLPKLNNVFDMVWVDGNHEYSACMGDLINCQKLNIANILVDDYRELDSVKKAVNDFCSTTSYRVSNQSCLIDSRGIVYLTK